MAKEKHLTMNLLKTLEHHQLLELFSEDFCHNCQCHLDQRIRSFLLNEKSCDDASRSSENSERTVQQKSCHQSSISTPGPINSPRKKDYIGSSLPPSLDSKHCSFEHSGSEEELNGGIGADFSLNGDELSQEEENTRVSEMGWKDDFRCLERINGRFTNVLQGLALYTRVFNPDEQKKIVEFVYKLQDMGKKRQLRGRTYSEPRKWMRGKGRVTIQFGCCYNYAEDKHGNLPGIIRDAEVEPLPPLFKQMIKRMVRWHVLPKTCIPDSCIVNIYEEGDCIPPHIDHHDFLRPFCTVSLLSECNILFGSDLKIAGAGEFRGPTSVRLPLGSVLICKGNAANITKHCISAVPAKRISITFRKMDTRKVPLNFEVDPEMQRIKPLLVSSPKLKSHNFPRRKYHNYKPVGKRANDEINYVVETSDFPPFRRLRVYH